MKPQDIEIGQVYTNKHYPLCEYLGIGLNNGKVILCLIKHTFLGKISYASRPQQVIALNKKTKKYWDGFEVKK